MRRRPLEKKRTAIIGTVPDNAILQRCCTGQGAFCSNGRPHVILRGIDPASGLRRTKLAEHYPVQFARAVATALAQAADAIEFERVCKLAC